MTSLIVVIVAAMAAANIAGRMVTWARRRAMVAIPNERSSHSEPTPTGAGVAIVAVTVLGFVALQAAGLTGAAESALVTLLFATLVAIVSWFDDRRGLSVPVRLICHGVAAGLLLGAVGPLTHVPLPGLGAIALGSAAVVFGVWWIVGFANAFNFMDGIDGLAGTQGVIAGLAWGVAGSVAGQPAIAMLGFLIAGASLGFLRHNWAPAAIFMGDVGAVFLGFLLAALTLVGAKTEPMLFVVGLAIVWPFLFDATFTFVRRALRRENLLKAHRSHLYQRLVIAGWSHGSVTLLYGAAAVVTSVAGLALLRGVPNAEALLASALAATGGGLWFLTAAEEWRRGRPQLAPDALYAGLNRFGRNRYILFADVALIAFAAFTAFALRFDGLFVYYRSEFPLFLFVSLIVKPLVFFAFGLYKRYWRYASVWDLVAVVLGVSAAEIVVGTIMLATVMVEVRLFDYVSGFPRSVLPIDWLVTLTCAGGVRMSVRVFSESAAGRRNRAGHMADGAPKRVLIVGAGEAGILVLREIRRNPTLRMHVVGFLDDDPAKVGKRIQATTVLGPLTALVAIALAHDVDEAIVALPSAPGTVVRKVIESCQEAGISSTSVPGIFELLDGNLNISRLRSVEIGDLLRRSPVASSQTSARYLAGQTVLVTGAGGSIGSELCYQITRARPKRIVLLGHGENSIFAAHQMLKERAPGVAIETVIADVRDEQRLLHVFQSVRPTAVFHAAAHKHVPLMEENVEEAITNNVFWTRNVVRAAVETGVQRLVLISTDKAVQATSVMGASKRIAEMIVADAARRYGRAFVVVRFGNVLGSRGSVVPVFKRQIELGRPIQITHPDMKRFFMTIPEAVHLVLEAGGLGRGGELFVLNMGQPVAIVDLARDLIRLSGYEVDDIPIVFTGLRPGEKLEEALWEPGATVQPTENPEVLRVEEPSAVHGDVNEIVGFLQSAVETRDDVALRFVLSTCMPSFAAAVRDGADQRA